MGFSNSLRQKIVSFLCHFFFIFASILNDVNVLWKTFAMYYARKTLHPPCMRCHCAGGGGCAHKTQQRFARVENFSRFYTGRCAGRASSWKCNKSKVQRCVLSSKMRARAKRVKHTKKTSKRNSQKEKREGERGREKKQKPRDNKKVLWKLKENAVPSAGKWY